MVVWIERNLYAYITYAEERRYKVFFISGDANFRANEIPVPVLNFVVQ